MQTNTPGRPDLPYKPELATPVAAPKKHRGWIIAFAILGGLILLGAGSAINSGEPGTRVVDPVTIEQPSDGPTSYEGNTVQEGVDIMYAIGAAEVICPLIDTYGEAEARNAWLTTPPQLGTDEYEGAVFDAWLATEPC